MARKTTGRFDSRAELEDFVHHTYRNTEATMSQIARAARVSQPTVGKILDKKPQRKPALVPGHSFAEMARVPGLSVDERLHYLSLSDDPIASVIAETDEQIDLFESDLAEAREYSDEVERRAETAEAAAHDAVNKLKDYQYHAERAKRALESAATTLEEIL